MPRCIAKSRFLADRTLQSRASAAPERASAAAGGGALAVLPPARHQGQGQSVHLATSTARQHLPPLPPRPPCGGEDGGESAQSTACPPPEAGLGGWGGGGEGERGGGEGAAPPAPAPALRIFLLITNSHSLTTSLSHPGKYFKCPEKRR